MSARHALPVALLLSALPFAAGAQDFEGKVSYRASMAGVDMEMTHYIKGQKLRQEMSGPMGDMAMVMDLESGKMAMFAPGHPDPMVMSIDEMRAMGGDIAPSADFTVTSTGRTETVAGYACEHYLIEQGEQRSDVCAASGLGFYTSAMGGGMGDGGGATALALDKLRDQFEDGFFPLKVSMSTPQGAMEMEVVSLERASLSDDLFKIDGGQE